MPLTRIRSPVSAGSCSPADDPKRLVHIPLPIREKLGITPNSEVDFVEEGERVYIRKILSSPSTGRFHRFRGAATVKMTTQEILSLTRGEA